MTQAEELAFIRGYIAGLTENRVKLAEFIDDNPGTPSTSGMVQRLKDLYNQMFKRDRAFEGLTKNLEEVRKLMDIY